MIIQNKELNKMLKVYGKQYVLTMYANRKFDMTKKQLEYVLKYGDKNDKEKSE